MPSKRVRTLIRATPTDNHTEISACTVNHYEADTSAEQTQKQNDDEYIYDSDDDPRVNASVILPQWTSSSSSATGITAPIATANQVTEIRAPVVLDNRVENMAPVVLGNEVTNAMAPSMVTSATNIMAPIASAN